MRTPPLLIRNEEEMAAVGAALAQVLRAGDIIGLSGGLGVGKTTLTRGLLRELGLEEEAPSPSFAIVQGYELPEVRLPLAHVDLYRLEEEADMEELGLDDYLCDGALIIEWPERMGARLWKDALLIAIENDGQSGARRLTATLSGAWKERWPFQ